MNAVATRVAILASGSGTNAEAIIRYFHQQRKKDVEVAVVLSNNPDAYVLTRAQQLGVATHVFTRQQLKEGDVVQLLIEKKITHVVLAGFLWLVPAAMVAAFPNRIVNIHPALLPKFGGNGMYGMKVHEAVKAAGETETGITIHLVNEHYDDGQILFQARVGVSAQDTPQSIAAKVHALEHRHYPEVIEQWISGTIS
jgi:phosphoribosylglycinamide formyltransferase-1